MEGGGRYNAHSALQASGAALALPWLEDAAADAPAPPDGAVIFVDYGSSEGRNSQRPVRLVIDSWRRRFGPGRDLLVLHTDLPGNDFSSLFREADSEQGYVLADDRVIPTAVGRSFYRPVAPANSVSLGWCSYAVQWLRAPEPYPPGAMVAWRLEARARARVVAEAEADWRLFLSLRAQELRPGARIIVVAPAATDEGVHPSAPIFDAATAALGELERAGRVTAEERARARIAVYPRTPDETVAPFVTGGAPGLRLVESKFVSLPDSSHERFLSDGDADGLAARRAGFFRATFGPSLVGALDPSTPERRREALDAFEIELRARLREKTARLDARVALLLIERAK